MRILFISQWFDPEPGAIRGLPLAKHLRAQGDDVEVLTGFPNYPGGTVYSGYRIQPWQRETLEGVPVLRVPLYPSHNASAAKRIANYGSYAVSAATVGLALARQADVAYVYHPPATAGLPAVLLKYLRRTPFVYHIADMWPESVVESGMLCDGAIKPAVSAALSSMCGLMYKEASRISVLSPGFKRILESRNVPSDKIEVIYNWTDEGVFHPVARDNQLAESLGLRDKFSLMYAGNLGPFQGVDVAIRAASLLRDLPDFRLAIVGTGRNESDLKDLARNLGCSNVVFVGRREYWEMPRFYSLADALLVHLRDYPFFAATIPSKTQVSMACARPLLMAVRGDAADLVRRANCGVVCEPDNPEAMAAAIRGLHAAAPEERERMGRLGREFYMRNMSLDEGARRTRDLLAAAATRQPLPVRSAYA